MGWLFAAIAGVATIWLMLRAVTARGGEQDGDAARSATRTLNQIDAFRIRRGKRDAWDGTEHHPGSQGSDSGI